MFPTRIELPDSSGDLVKPLREELGFEVETDEVSIVEMSTDDADHFDWYEIFKDEDMGRVWQFYPENPPSSVKGVADWITRYESNKEDHAAVRYVIRHQGDIAGQLGFNIDWKRSTADSQVWLRERYWGSGLAYYAYPALASLAFRYLEVDLYTATYILDNDRVEGSIEKIIAAIPDVISHEAVVKNWYRRGGEIKDVKRVSVEREEALEWAEENREFYDAFQGRIRFVR